MNVRSTLGNVMSGVVNGGRERSLVVVASGWGLLVGGRMILPVVLPSLQETHGLSLSVAGLLMTTLWLFSSIGQLPSGMLADRYSERRLMATSMAVVAIAIGLVVTAFTPALLFVATALWGLGLSLYPIARITFLARLYSDKLGSALGVTMATGDVGQTVLPPLAATVTGALAWQAGLGIVVPLLLVSGALILIVLPTQSESERPTDSRSIRQTLDVFGKLRDPAMGTMAVILFLYMFIWQSFTAFYPTYLTTNKGLSSAVASVLFGFFFAVGVVVKPMGGVAYDRFGMRKSLLGILLPPVAGFLLLPVVDDVWMLVGLTALISTMLGSGAITQSYLADSFSAEEQGTGLGVIRTTSATLGATGPVIFGVIADYDHLNEGYVGLAVVMVVVILLTLRMPRAGE